MPSCNDRETRAAIDEHFAARSSPRTEHAMREHVAGCADCRAYYDRHLLLAAMDPDRAVAPVDRLAVGLGVARRRSTRAPMFLGGLAVAAAAAMVVVAAPRLDSSRTEFTSRGTVTTAAEASLVVYRAAPGGQLERLDGSAIGKSDQLAFAYTNRAGWPYLLVFAVDEHGHVYWYHPAWEDPKTTPRAVSIAPGAEARELPDATEHSLDGQRLRVIGLFTHAALSTRDVEARLAGRPDSDFRTVFPDGFTSVIELRVEGR